MADKLTVLMAPGARAEGGGVCNFMSWTRFEEAMRHYGEVKPDERIEKIVADGNGLTIYYKDR
jgi:aspartyl-tRNA synthetase